MMTWGAFLSRRSWQPTQRQAHWLRDGSKAASTGSSVVTSKTTNQYCQRPRILSHFSSTETIWALTRSTSHWETIGHKASANPKTQRRMVVLWTPHQRPNTESGTFQWN